MLVQLSIYNVAIIDHTEITLDGGLNILTGETGAGKSIIIDAVNLVLGERGDRDKIRSGAKSARVEAVFEASKPETRAMLQELGLWGEDDSLILCRELFETGRNVCRINGHLATLTQLRAVTGTLVDMHGQHEHQSLLDETKHVALLDDYGGPALAASRGAVEAAYEAYAAKRREWQQLTGSEHDRLRRMDLLAFQIHELEQANLTPGEGEELRGRRELLRHAERIRAALAAAYAALYAGQGEEMPGAIELVGEAQREVEHIGHLDSQFSDIAKGLEEASYTLDDLAGQVRDRLDGDDFDPGQLEDVEERLELLAQLQRKYGADETEMLAYYDSVVQEYDRLSHSEQEGARLEQEVDIAAQRWLAAAQGLQRIRHEAAERLQQAVMRQLADLGMERARFAVHFSPVSGDEAVQPARQGLENLQFLLSANPGEPLRPLSKIASGGEMSRILLALKTVTADMDDIPCLIFDEIDTGISGEMSQRVAQKLAIVARQRQVVCVTHSAQIAAMADSHFLIEKQMDDVHTQTRVTPLDEEGHTREVSRLMGGDPEEALAYQHAQRVIGRCRAWKVQQGLATTP